jgi:hypothetical protein
LPAFNCPPRVDAWIEHSWRDAADQDYLAARIGYRYQLTQPFLWSSQQAVEKYLKATRAHLVWKNFGYGTRPKRRIKNFPARMAWSQPVTFMRPEVYEAVKSLVKFDPAVKAHFESKLTKNP